MSRIENDVTNVLRGNRITITSLAKKYGTPLRWMQMALTGRKPKQMVIHILISEKLLPVYKIIRTYRMLPDSLTDYVLSTMSTEATMDFLGNYSKWLQDNEQVLYKHTQRKPKKDD